VPFSDSKDFYIVDQQPTKGLSLFAKRKFRQGEAIYPFDYWSREIMPIHMTNHSCSPNGRFDSDGMLIALQDIEADVEITYDYLLHPIPASPWDFECYCESDACIGHVRVVQAE
jgi:hypothetical protein